MEIVKEGERAERVREEDRRESPRKKLISVSDIQI